MVVDRLDGAVLFADPQILDVSRDGVLDQHGLKHVGHLVGQAPEQRQLSVKQWRVLLDALAEFGVGEPDEIFKAGRDKLLRRRSRAVRAWFPRRNTRSCTRCR